MSVPAPPSVPARAKLATRFSPPNVSPAPLATTTAALLASRSLALSTKLPALTLISGDASVPAKVSVPASTWVGPV